MYYYYNIIRIVCASFAPSTESSEFMSIWSLTPSLAKNYIFLFGEENSLRENVTFALPKDYAPKRVFGIGFRAPSE
jgi:hypothetical protein